MSVRKSILDNRDLRVVDHLRDWLADADMLRFVSALVRRGGHRHPWLAVHASEAEYAWA